ncbi:MAG: DNA polymerase IV [Gudongella sp.]|jgi:DNA polymerase-4|nr:DNA polymerase IV [Gudongella sp.]
MTDRIVFHIDANSAYLSWEAAYRLQHGASVDLREVPSIVGGDQAKRHGIVLAKSIPAKKFGILTGETVHSAFEKCPELIMVPPCYHRYIIASDSMVELIKGYSPSVQRYSVDEVFLEYTDKSVPFMTAAMEISRRIKNELGFTVNIGISSNKLLAKMASDFTKPDRIHTLFKEEIQDKMWPLPVEDLFMVGSRTKRKLNGRGIFTIGQLARLDRDYICSWLKKPGLLIWEYANGIENSPVISGSIPLKSVGNSTTLPFNVETKDEAYKVLLAISEMIGLRIRNLNMCGNVISVALKNHLFYSYSHQKKFMLPTDSTNNIYRTSIRLFDEMWQGEPLRNFSISLSQLESNDFFQLSLVEKYNKKEHLLDSALDDIRLRYGQKSVYRSCFLYSGIDPVIGGVLEEESYPMMSGSL